jgi:hypothetical protein
MASPATSTAKTKTEERMEQAILDHANDDERVLCLTRAKKFKRTWIELAEVLVKVREKDSYRSWGFASFDDYVTRELHLRRGTVDKLLASYGFIRANAPRLLRAEDDDYAAPIPTWQAVDFVARAEERGAVNDETLDEMKRAVFEEGAPMPALSRKYREVAFPVADDEKKERSRAQIAAAARRLADLIADSEADVPRGLAEQVESVCGEVVAAMTK